MICEVESAATVQFQDSGASLSYDKAIIHNCEKLETASVTQGLNSNS